jgi:hypothetical protein
MTWIDDGNFELPFVDAIFHSLTVFPAVFYTFYDTFYAILRIGAKNIQIGHAFCGQGIGQHGHVF